MSWNEFNCVYLMKLWVKVFDETHRNSVGFAVCVLYSAFLRINTSILKEKLETNGKQWYSVLDVSAFSPFSLFSSALLTLILDYMQ